MCATLPHDDDGYDYRTIGRIRYYTPVSTCGSAFKRVFSEQAVLEAVDKLSSLEDLLTYGEPVTGDQDANADRLFGRDSSPGTGMVFNVLVNDVGAYNIALANAPDPTIINPHDYMAVFTPAATYACNLEPGLDCTAIYKDETVSAKTPRRDSILPALKRTSTDEMHHFAYRNCGGESGRINSPDTPPCATVCTAASAFWSNLMCTLSLYHIDIAVRTNPQACNENSACTWHEADKLDPTHPSYCALKSGALACDNLVSTLETVLCGSMLVLGIAMAFSGLRYFKASVLLNGFLLFTGIVYIIVAKTNNGNMDYSVQLMISVFSGVAGALLLLAAWHYKNSASSVLVTVGLVMGWVIASFVFATPLGSLAMWKNSFNFIMCFLCVALIFPVFLLMKPKLLHVLSTSIVGSYLFMFGLDYFLGSGALLLPNERFAC